MTCNASTKAKRRSQAPKSNLTIAFLKKNLRKTWKSKKESTLPAQKNMVVGQDHKRKTGVEDAKMKIDGIGVVNFKH